MPTDITEDSLDLTIDLLEAITPEPGDASYPFPKLKPAGRAELRQFRTVVLENPYLRVVVVPDLGGRILSLVDKRTGIDIVPSAKTLDLREGGPRGVYSPAGIQVVTDFHNRLNSLGTVVIQPDFTDEEIDPAGVWWGEVCGNGLSLNVRISLPPDRAALTIEARVFNRDFQPHTYNGGIVAGLGLGELLAAIGSSIWHHEGKGIRFTSDDSLAYDNLAEGEVAIHRFYQRRSLAPRQLDSWSLHLEPFSGLRGLTDSSRDAVVFFDSEVLQVQVTQIYPAAKLVIYTEAGQTLEMTADLYPETVLEIPLTDLASPIKALVILDTGRNEIFRSLGCALCPFSQTIDVDALLLDDGPKPDWDIIDLNSATFAVPHRAIAHLILGYRHLADKEFHLANRAFEQALLFNAEDHLLWWIKAITQRLAGEEAEERAELLNAHFLAPLEPALRAESYLVSPSHTKEASAVLRPLEETPDVFIDVACLLLEANLIEEASKWIDEALRHADLAMLRYLLAFAYLSASRMGVEAADQVAAAGKRPASPPYPYRAIERKALQALREQFPEDPVLAQYAAYLPV